MYLRLETKRRVFYSFHYENDNWVAEQIRNIGTVEGNKPVSPNDWEQVKQDGASAIKKWIDGQIKYRSCTIVLVGSETAKRKWIRYEIARSWEEKKGVAGIYIHGLKRQDGQTSKRGDNPFDYVKHPNGKAMSSVVKCHNPKGHGSQLKYDWIAKNLSDIVKKAIGLRSCYK